MSTENSNLASDPNFKELVKQATKEVIREETQKMQSQTQYLQEGNMHLNE